MPAIRKSARKVATQNYVDAMSSAEESEARSHPPPKRQRTKNQSLTTVTVHADPKWKHTRGKRGLLQEVADFPLDVLYEIFSHLLPKDILALSRTTKDLRGILTTRSAKSIWANARENVPDLPPCPEDLNEIQYANLLFSNHCHHCLSPKPMRTVLWNCRTRACTDCCSRLYEHIEWNKVGGMGNFIRFDRVKHYYGPDGKNRKDVEVYQKDQIEAVVDDLVLPDGRGAAYWNEFNAAIYEHSQLCQRWWKLCSWSRNEELSQLFNKRREAIMQRLKDAGWSAELELQENFQGLDFLISAKHFKDSRPMTERIWSNMKESLISLMERERTRRIKTELSQKWTARHNLVHKVIKDRLKAEPADKFLPPVGTVAAYPPFTAIWLETPIDEEVTADSLKAFLEDLSPITEAWMTSAKAKLLNIMVDSQYSEGAITDLSLATLVFQCAYERCEHTEAMQFPHVLYHKCNSSGYNYGSPLKAFSKETSKMEWSSEYLSLGRIKTATKIVKACGLDPAVATQSMMDDLNPLLERRANSADTSEDKTVTKRSIYTWRQAMQKCSSYRSKWGSWVMLNEEDAQVARSQRKTASQPPRSSDDTVLKPILCNHCDRAFSTRFSFANHLRGSHPSRFPITQGDWHWTARLPNDSVMYKTPWHLYLESSSSEDSSDPDGAEVTNSDPEK